MRTLFDFVIVSMNALIEANAKFGRAELSFADIVHYAKSAARIYRRVTGCDTTLLLSKAHQVDMVEYCYQYLDVDAYYSRSVFRLRADAPIEEIENIYRWPLDPDFRNALLSPEAVRALSDSENRQ